MTGVFYMPLQYTGMKQTTNKSQHTKLTLEKKILWPLPPGFELATFRSQVQSSNQQATDVRLTTETQHSDEKHRVFIKTEYVPYKFATTLCAAGAE